MTNYQITPVSKEITDELSKLVEPKEISIGELVERLERSRNAIIDPTETSGSFIGLAGYLNENGDYMAVEGALIDPYTNKVRKHGELYEGSALHGFNLDAVSEAEQKALLLQVNTGGNPLSKLLRCIGYGRASSVVYKSRDKPIGAVQQKDGWQVFRDKSILTPAGEPIFLRDGTAYILDEFDDFSDSDLSFTGYKVL